MKYNCHDVFMIRTPALSLRHAENMYGHDYKRVWEYIVSSGLKSYMMEALLISSPSLYEAVKRLEKNEEIDEMIYLSLYKYLIRAATRPTPYGIFASVTLGEFTADEANVISTSKVEKSIRADGLWINKLINDLEHRQDILESLTLSWNKNCYISRNRVRNPFFSSHGTLNEIKKASLSIRYTKLIEFIMENVDEAYNYLHLIELIHEEYPDVEIKKIRNTINLLIGLIIQSTKIIYLTMGW